MRTACGLYHGLVGLTLLAAPFFFGASLVFLAMPGVMLLIREWGLGCIDNPTKENYTQLLAHEITLKQNQRVFRRHN